MRFQINASPLFKIIFFLITVFSTFCFSNDLKHESTIKPPPLVIYTYDSLLAKGGLGEVLFPKFTKKTLCEVRTTSAGDAGSILSRLKAEKKQGSIHAHIVLGIDQFLWNDGKDFFEIWDVSSSFVAKEIVKLKPEIKFESGFLPFDYGIFTFIADKKKMKELGLPLPKSYEDLLQPIYKRKILIQDPRLSTPGLGFLTTLQTVYKDKTVDYLKKFRSQWLTLTSGWDHAYSLFLKEEAPLVWSYTTSEAYHRENEKTQEAKSRYQALNFNEGHILQIEGAAMVKGIQSDPIKRCAQEFLSFLISEELQQHIPLKNWMLPVRTAIALPGSFTSSTIYSPKILPVDTSITLQTRLMEWKKALESPLQK